ncbi:threonine--tRNA ligase, mitochondrial 1 [Arabidopsis lyrata subsp. lyrata]|nr:threonine--tRNA ligase, mitochondrial 1 [Arabidopsis lyrata subsp. lyrata]|eukprot:XP_020869720.1 threonine--tRNA ligase, mitochondrial 1 [Arabidopsis lyrata subsp. lyrata]
MFWQLNKGNGKFYGPSIDVRISDAVKKNIQCGTLQLDFQQPDRFKLEYSSSAEDEMFFILLEHYEGKWPFWLSPHQAIVCSLSEKHRSYAEKVRDQIHEARYYVDVDISGRKIEEKVREAQAAQYNYILAVGDFEAATGQVSVRRREENGSDFVVMSIEALLDVFKAQE